ncbi:hypothetical protein N8813_00175 [bacterium]|nr:hypothetical protein [bacterium]
MMFSFAFLILAVFVVIGLGVLIVWLCKQVGGVKNSMGEAKARQEEMERDPIDFE